MISRPLLPALALAFSFSAAFGATVYSDNFDGTSGSGLDGNAPDVRPGTETWSANPAYTYASPGLSSPSGTTSRGAYLPFVPQTGYIYDLQATIQFAAASSDGRSLQMGFIAGTPAGSINSAITASSNGPVFFLRNARTYELRADGGSSLPSSYAGTVASATTPHTFRIVLDTSGAQWILRGYLDGSQVGADYTFTTNPTIQGVGLANNTSGGQSAVGTFSNFILTQEQVPEPSSVLLLLAGACPLLCRRSRRPE